MADVDKPLVRALHLFALSGLAVAQPVFDLVTRNATFLVAHRVTPGEIVVWLCLLLFAPPLATFVVGAVVGWLHAGAGRWLHRIWVAAFVAIAAAPLAKRASLSDLPTCAACLAVGVAAAFAYTRVRAVRTFVSVYALAPLAFAGVFAFDDSVWKLLVAPVVAPVAEEVEADAPIVMVIFDELPTISLLDAAGEIDRMRYPNFARLADGSTWFRNASGVHFHTEYAVPSMLTGRYPDTQLLPIEADHSKNLFSLLSAAYDLEVVENFTSLYPKREQGRVLRWADYAERMRRLLWDTGVIYLHVVSPPAAAAELPPLNQGWKGFGRPGERMELLNQSFEDRRGRFREFVRSISPPRDRPTLHYLHILLPHHPWSYLPDGKLYVPERNFGTDGSKWEGDAFWVEQAYQRHLLQLEFLDRLVGELLGRLHSTGMFDRTLLVVAADHGIGFWPGQPRRPLPMAHPEDVLGVPLFIKAPFQQQGRIDDGNVEVIDIVPTIGQLIGVEIPWEMDGCSALASDCPVRTHKTMYTFDPTPMTFPPRLPLQGPSLKRKLALFGSGSQEGLFRTGRYRSWVGRRVADLPLGTPGRRPVSLLRESFEFAARHPESYETARIVGRVSQRAPLPEGAQLAVVVRGTVAAVVPTSAYDRNTRMFSAMLGPSDRPARGEEVEVYLVVGEPGSATLRKLPTALSR